MATSHRQSLDNQPAGKRSNLNMLDENEGRIFEIVAFIGITRGLCLAQSRSIICQIFSSGNGQGRPPEKIRNPTAENL